MERLKTAGKAAALVVLAFLAAFGAGATPVARSYPLAILVSVILCPLALGFLGSRGLKLGALATVLGVNLLPVVSAFDDVLRLGDPVQARWIVASLLVSWAGWRLGAADDARRKDMAK